MSCQEAQNAGAAAQAATCPRPRSIQCTKSVADSTPTQRPSPVTTGAPVIASCASRWAAPLSDMASGIRTTDSDIRSAAVRLNRGLVAVIMAHLGGRGRYWGDNLGQ